MNFNCVFPSCDFKKNDIGEDRVLESDGMGFEVRG